VSDDTTLGGYQDVHDRPPAFGGPDGRAYSVAVYVDESPAADGRYGAVLLFVQWSVEGDRVVSHLESPYLAFADTPQRAEADLRQLSLVEVKRHLDAVVAANAEHPGW
jgi:hypothetical protein